MTRYAGVDVGAERKGFHVAVVDDVALLAGPRRISDLAAVSAFLFSAAPAVVAVDAPRATAPTGRRSRPAERALAAAVCGIRYTPDVATIAHGAYYAWIRHGLALYRAIEDGPWEVVECFPTASWTRWYGARDGASRAAWSQNALAALGLVGVPPCLDQDGRDAIGAALTARAHARGGCEAFGEIVVPR